MKNTLFNLIILVVIGILTTQAFQKTIDSNLRKELTDDQLSLIEGKGCSFFAWLAAIAADVGCAVAPDPWACLAAAGTSADCISQLLGSSSGSGTPNTCTSGCGGGSIGPNGKPLPIAQ
ncbi:MAG: hypothetical protein JST37_04305 [Bacteroidetes bacterium]|nr:hypothetical protein [Bacteroidota bacterium]MBS1980810.1 hypothetical protein [Bacteroidota bacterium]